MIQTELHRHVDCAFRIPTAYKLAQRNGIIGSSTSLESFREMIQFTKPLLSLSEVIEKFYFVQKLYTRLEDFEQMAFEGVEDCYLEGTRKVELRYSLGHATAEAKLSWEDVQTQIENGVNRAQEKYPDIKVGLILIATREYDPSVTAETVDFYLKNRSRFVAMDIAGDESQTSAREFIEVMKPVKEAVQAGEAHLTVHAGESQGPENVWKAIEELGAERIGHGIRCIEDPELMKYLAEKEICLEICPKSNYLIGAVQSLESHPLPEILRADIPVSVNTDDPAFFANDLPSEFEILKNQLELSDSEIESIKRFADEKSFLS